MAAVRHYGRHTPKDIWSLRVNKRLETHVRLVMSKSFLSSAGVSSTRVFSSLVAIIATRMTSAMSKAITVCSSSKRHKFDLAGHLDYICLPDRLHLTDLRWTRVEAAGRPHPACEKALSFLYNHYIYVLGGYGDGFDDDIAFDVNPSTINALRPRGWNGILSRFCVIKRCWQRPRTSGHKPTPRAGCPSRQL